MATTSTVDVPLGGGDPRPFRLLSKPSLIALAIGLLAVLSSVTTYASLTGLIPYTPTHGGLIFLSIINLALVLALGALIAWRLTRLWAERRSGSAGARLHVRLVTMFSVMAVVPAILVAIFAAVTLDLGVEAWFSAHVKSALESAVNVTHRYGDEKQDLIVTDAREIAKDIQRDPQLFDANGKADVSFLFSRLQILTEDHGLQAAYILNGKGQVLGSSKLRSLPDLQPPSASEIAQAARGPVLIDANSKIGVLRALVRARCPQRRLSARRAARRSGSVCLLPAYRRCGGRIQTPRSGSREIRAHFRGALRGGFAAHSAGFDLAGPVGCEPADQSDCAA